MKKSILLNTDTQQYILSYLGKELYQDKKKQIQIRFNFNNILGYLFKDVSQEGSLNEIEEEESEIEEAKSEHIIIKYTLTITRPKCTCVMSYIVIDYGSDLNNCPFYEVNYVFHDVKSPDTISLPFYIDNDDDIDADFTYQYHYTTMNTLYHFNHDFFIF